VRDGEDSRRWERGLHCDQRIAQTSFPISTLKKSYLNGDDILPCKLLASEEIIPGLGFDVELWVE